MSTTDQAQLLGEIKGIVNEMRERQKEHGQKLDGMDSRLRAQETTVARNSMAVAGAMSLGLALVIEGLKTTFRIKGGGS